MRTFILLSLLALLGLVACQDEEGSGSEELCSLNKLLDGKCTADDDIKCRRCFFKACHNPGSGSPLRPLPVPGAADSQQFGRPFGPQNCDELNKCLAAADCKNE